MQFARAAFNFPKRFFVREKRAADAGDKTDELPDEPEAFARMRKTHPRTKLRRRILFAVGFPFRNPARFRIDRQGRTPERVPVNAFVDREHDGTFRDRQPQRERFPGRLIFGFC